MFRPRPLTRSRNRRPRKIGLLRRQRRRHVERRRRPPSTRRANRKSFRNHQRQSQLLVHLLSVRRLVVPRFEKRRSPSKEACREVEKNIAFRRECIILSSCLGTLFPLLSFCSLVLECRWLSQANQVHCRWQRNLRHSRKAVPRMRSATDRSQLSPNAHGCQCQNRARICSGRCASLGHRMRQATSLR